MSLIVVESGALLVAVCSVVAVWAGLPLQAWTDLGVIVAKACALSASCVVAFYYNDLYDLRVVRSAGAVVSRLFQSLGVACLLLAGLYALFPETRLAHGAFVTSLAVAVGLLISVRAISYGLPASSLFRQRILIVGASPLAHMLIAEIDERRHLGYRVVGIADDPNGEDHGRLPRFGPLEHLDKIIEEVMPHRVIVTLRERRGRLPVRQLLDILPTGIVVEDGIAVYERLTGKLAIESLSPSVLVFSPDFRKSRAQLLARRAVNLVIGVVGSLLAAPLMALVGLAVVLDSRGSVLFTQERVGLHGRRFRAYKFRTMHERAAPAEESVWSRDDDRQRITRVGHVLRRLRLDELPQLWNIARGDMDLVGPRPEMAANVKAMSESIPYYSLRHSVRPGLTGWAQVKQGYSVSLVEVTEKARFDLYYIKHMSFWLDLQILFDTVKIVLFGRGAR